MAAAEVQKRDLAYPSPLKSVLKLFEAQIPLEPGPSPYERSYALGWIRTELPGRLGMAGQNARWREMPLVG